jgi:hypothetical protein
VKVGLNPRDGGAISPCKWGSRGEIYTTFLSITEALGVTPNELLIETDDMDYQSAIAYRIAQLPTEKQQKLLKILDTLVEEI